MITTVSLLYSVSEPYNGHGDIIAVQSNIVNFITSIYPLCCVKTCTYNMTG